MNTKQIEKLKQQARMIGVEELSSQILADREELKSTPSERYASEIMQRMEVWTAEMARRKEDGGKIEPDTRQPYMTDGERSALGLSDRDDNH